MGKNQNGNAAEGCRLSRFERNRFFHGKLMTARDMQAEQNYHAGRLNAIARRVLGEGIVCGLETTVVAAGDALEVTVQPGLALDCGRPVVVENKATEEIDRAGISGETGVSLYLEYDNCVKESVPVPGSEDACEEECTYNRILEIFEISHEEGPPDEQKPVRQVLFPAKDDLPTLGEDGVPDPTDDGLHVLAESYYEDADGALRSCETDEDGAVFLGHFTGGADGPWTRTTDGETRPHVYTNDMLYAAIARHAADFGNPHDVTAEQAGALVSVEEVSNPGGNVDLHSPDDSIGVAGNDGADRVDLVSQVTAADLGAITGVDGVENPGGNVDLHSPDDSIGIDPDDGADRVDLVSQVTAADLGAITGVEGVSNPGGNVDLHSPDGSVGIDANDGADRVDLTVSGDVIDRLAAHERYVRNRVLKYTIESFYEVARTFANTPAGVTAAKIVHVATRAIQDEDYVDGADFFGFVRTVLKDEVRLRRQLAGLDATVENLKTYESALDDLFDVTSGEVPDSAGPAVVAKAAVVQKEVGEAARLLAPAGENPIPLPGDYTVPRGLVNEPLVGGYDGPVIEEIPDLTGGQVLETDAMLADSNVTVNYRTPSGDQVDAETASDYVAIDQTEEATAESEPRELTFTVQEFETADVVSGIGDQRLQTLADAGYGTTYQVANADARKLADAAGVSLETAETWKQEAQQRLESADG